MTSFQVFGSILFLLVAFLISWWYYRGQKSKQLEGIRTFWLYSLIFLRSLGLFLIGILLLGYAFSTTIDEEDEPVIIWIQDNSSSILYNKDSSYYNVQYINDVQKVVNDIQSNFEFSGFSFSDDVSDSLILNFSGKETNISNAFEYIFDRFYNRNIGAIILASDGIYNRGVSPVFTSGLVDFVPVYSIALGDSTQQKDLFIKDIAHNKLAFLGNDFAVKVDIQALEINNGEYELALYQNGKKIKSTTVEIDSSHHYFEKEWVLSADKLGIQKYSFTVTEMDNEITYLNNQKDIYVDVVDSRQKILILADAPHPDIRAIKTALGKNKNYEIKTQMIRQNPVINEDYSLLILHNLPSDFNNDQLKTILHKDIPKLFVVGNGTDFTALSSLNNGFKGLSPRGMESVQPKINDGFSLFTIQPELRKTMQEFPPLFSPYADYNFSANVKVLAYQSVAGVKKDNPLIAFSKQNEVNNAFILGEGLWRWRLIEGKNNKNATVFDELLQKIVQVTALKEDRSRLRIDVKNEWTEQDEIIFKGEFYNSAYELYNDPELKLNLINENDESFDYSFLKTDNNYRINLGVLSAGTYQWKASLTDEGKTYEKKGLIVVESLDREGLVTKANHRLLKDLSEKSGAKVFYPNNMFDLVDELKNRGDIGPVVYQKDEVYNLIDWKILLFIIAFCFTSEWFIRKYHGAL